MSGEGAGKLIFSILSSAVTVLLVIFIIDALVGTGLGPKPGDPLYPAWARNINVAANVLPLLVTGVGAVAAYIITQIRGF